VPAAKFLLRQVQNGLPKEQVTELFAARFDPKRIKTIVLGESPAKGSDDPAVTIVEFADFECPACGMAYPLLEKVYAKYAKQVRMVFKHFPLSAHPNAKLAAQAAYAAQKQQAFWKMHKMLFENQERLTEPDLIQYAETIGLDVDRFKKDLHSDEAKERVEQELKQGESLGVEATPTIFINGRDCDLTTLANPLKDLEDWIELDAQLAGKGSGADGDAAPSTSASTSAAPSAAPPAGSTTPATSSAKPNE
jgi:protein-disulfide isomerase